MISTFPVGPAKEPPLDIADWCGHLMLINPQGCFIRASDGVRLFPRLWECEGGGECVEYVGYSHQDSRSTEKDEDERDGGDLCRYEMIVRHNKHDPIIF